MRGEGRISKIWGCGEGALRSWKVKKQRDRISEVCSRQTGRKKRLNTEDAEEEDTESTEKKEG